VSIDTYIPVRAMAIVAHPDDIEFGIAGTMAKWVEAGSKVAYVICTSGDGGIADPTLSRIEAARIRESEQLAAAAVVGVDDVTFLREPDGLLECSLRLRKRLVREIRRFHPEVVITGDPTVMFYGEAINHPDHRAAATCAIDAVFPAAGQPHVFDDLELEGLKARKVRKMYITGRGEGDVFVDITATIETKIRALQCHASQVSHMSDLGDRIREWTANTAARGRKDNAGESDAAEMRFAEAFRVLTPIGDEEWAGIAAETG